MRIYAGQLNMVNDAEVRIAWWNMMGMNCDRYRFRLACHFENVPKGALLYIKCLSRGRQHRIFEFEDGKVFWR